ncbi:hypothetical protein [Pseudomonas sp.]|uniref:hypothetical protein n=1 Tax=Pseudomonas sp. TaxID=306 RepID=UPI00272C5ED6|nr:hypothetical protein [Pseudomonas sp.]
MNRPESHSENLIIRWYAAWRSRGMQLRGQLLLLALLPLLGVFLLTLWLGHWQMQREIARQADAVGLELSRQVAASVADPLAANDTLSLNILLAQWGQNPLIAHTSVSTVDNRVIAESGQRLSRANLAPGQGRFIAAVHIQDVLAGQLQLSLAPEPFTVPARAFLRTLEIGLGILALLSLAFAWGMAARMRRVLLGLAEWYGDSPITTPGLGRKDELGQLARRLAERRIVDMPPPILEERVDAVEEADQVALATPLADEILGDSLEEMPAEVFDLDDRAPEPDDEQPLAEATNPSPTEEDVPSAADSPSETTMTPVSTPDAAAPRNAVLAIRLGNQEGLRRLPRARLVAVLERYRTQLEQAESLYTAKLDTLDDGTSLLIFAAESGAEDHDGLTQAFICGELMRVLGHDLQVEIADTGISLHLQLAICYAPGVEQLEHSAMLQVPDCAAMFEQLEFSRNLLLLDASLANRQLTAERAVVRRLASHPGAYCVERLVDPYQTVLERQLKRLHTQQRG